MLKSFGFLPKVVPQNAERRYIEDISLKKFSDRFVGQFVHHDVKIVFRHACLPLDVDKTGFQTRCRLITSAS